MTNEEQAYLFPDKLIFDEKFKSSRPLGVALVLAMSNRDATEVNISTRRIADWLSVSQATVHRGLTAIENAGWIRRRHTPQTEDNPTGRIIVLCWRLPKDHPDYKSPV